VSPQLLLERLSFSHFVELLQLENATQRTFYEVEALRGHWSVRELKRQIATQYFQRSALSTDKAAVATMAHADAERASPQQVIRDPYVFEFLGLKSHEVVTEGQLEDALLDKLQAFLLELGHGFCFSAPSPSHPVGLGCMNLSHAYGTPPPPGRGRSAAAAARWTWA
jgi:predicted nuclease of restriction endonuclease-like (RecB) superfamily